MARVFLIRHGECLTNILDESEEFVSDQKNRLTQKGQADMFALGDFLKEVVTYPILMSSPLERAKESSQILSSFLNVEVAFEDALAERRFGFPPQTTILDSILFQKKDHLSPFDKRKNGESIFDHYNRVKGWFDKFQCQLQVENDYLVISHGGTIDLINMCIFQAPINGEQKFFTKCEPGHLHIWKIIISDDKIPIWRLDQVNYFPVSINAPIVPKPIPEEEHYSY